MEPSRRKKRAATAQDVLRSDLVGMWRDRQDIGDSAELGRKWRVEALRGDAVPAPQGEPEEPAGSEPGAPAPG